MPFLETLVTINKIFANNKFIISGNSTSHHFLGEQRSPCNRLCLGTPGDVGSTLQWRQEVVPPRSWVHPGLHGSEGGWRLGSSPQQRLCKDCRSAYFHFIPLNKKTPQIKKKNNRPSTCSSYFPLKPYFTHSPVSTSQCNVVSICSNAHIFF